MPTSKPVNRPRNAWETAPPRDAIFSGPKLFTTVFLKAGRWFRNPYSDSRETVTV